MTDDERREIVAAMREATARARGYADYFGWSPNRDLEEAGVVQNLRVSRILEQLKWFPKPVNLDCQNG